MSTTFSFSHSVIPVTPLTGAEIAQVAGGGVNDNWLVAQPNGQG